MKVKDYETLKNMEKSELEKLKLIEEISELKKPIWKKISFLSVIGSLILTCAAISVSIWQIKENKIKLLEDEKDRLEEKTRLVEKRENNVMTQYNEAIAEKAVVQSEKAQAISEKNFVNKEINNWKLEKRENELVENIQRFKKLNDELEKKSRNYKIGFIESFVKSNKTVRADIEKFSNEDNLEEFEKWLAEQFLWTALTRYENYILEQTTKISNDK